MTTRKQKIFKARLDDLSGLLDKVESHIPTLKDASAETVRISCTDQISKIRDKIKDGKIHHYAS